MTPLYPRKLSKATSFWQHESTFHIAQFLQRQYRKTLLCLFLMGSRATIVRYVSYMALQKCNVNFSARILGCFFVWIWGGEFLEGEFLRVSFSGKRKIRPQNSGLKHLHPWIWPQIQVHGAWCIDIDFRNLRAMHICRGNMNLCRFGASIEQWGARNAKTSKGRCSLTKSSSTSHPEESILNVMGYLLTPYSRSEPYSNSISCLQTRDWIGPSCPVSRSRGDPLRQRPYSMVVGMDPDLRKLPSSPLGGKNPSSDRFSSPKPTSTSGPIFVITFHPQRIDLMGNHAVLTGRFWVGSHSD